MDLTPPKIGISACLLGEPVRYDAGHKLDRYLRDTLGAFVQWVPVCPEVESGLPVPREAMRLVGEFEHPRLVTVRTRIDHTDRMVAWAGHKLDRLAEEHLSGFIFKSRSPSSGIQGVKIYNEKGIPSRKGVGLFARSFMERFPLLPVEDEGRLHDPRLRENFIERVFVYHRWNTFLQDNAMRRGLVDFHTRHKLLIMAHSPKHLRELGKLVAGPQNRAVSELFEAYSVKLMEGLTLLATVKKNTNVLHHIMGYFKKELSSDEKQELLEVVDNYHRALVPLIVPVVLLQHYVRTYSKDYLKVQYYLNPHPLELMLMNHV